MVTCVFAVTLVCPPALAVTRTLPSSVLYVTVTPPSGRRTTIVSNAVPRTVAVDVGVLISNLESAVFSFETDAQLRPSVCSIVSWMPPLSRRLSVVTFTIEPVSTVSVEPSKNVRTARPFSELFTTSPDANSSPSSAVAKSPVPPRCEVMSVFRIASVAATADERLAPRG